MSPPERTVRPAIFRHAQTLYDGLDQESIVDTINDVPIKVFRGRLTEAYNRLGISQSYYSSVTKALADNGCVTYIQKGARGAESIIALHHPPKEDEWQGEVKGLTHSGGLGIVAQQVRNIEDSLGGINVKLALVEVQKQLTELRSRVTALERKGDKIG